MAAVNQYSKLFQVLSQCLEVATVPEVINTLSPLLKRPASVVPVRFNKKRQKQEFEYMLDNNIRATKPEHLKKTKAKVKAA